MSYVFVAVADIAYPKHGGQQYKYYAQHQACYRKAFAAVLLDSDYGQHQPRDRKDKSENKSEQPVCAVALGGFVFGLCGVIVGRGGRSRLCALVVRCCAYVVFAR